jgi:hypothetical protein
MPDVPRIDVAEARRERQAGRGLLVCAYDDDAKCGRMKLDGSLTLSELRARLPSLPKSQELIFYCA